MLFSSNGIFKRPSQTLSESRSCVVDRRLPPRLRRSAADFSCHRDGVRCRTSAESAPELKDWQQYYQQLEPSAEDEYELLTQEEIDDRVDAAAGLISIIDELRPLDRSRFNAAYEIWKVIAAVPPEDRYRLIDEIEPGAIRTLWKHSMARYVLDDARSLDIFRNYAVWDDFPTEAGEVYTYWGRCEKFMVLESRSPFQQDSAMQQRHPRAIPWLQPSPGSWQFKQERFKASFFVHPESGELYSRLHMQLNAWVDSFWMPIYSKLDISLTLTPVQADAGADMTMVYPAQGKSLGLKKEHLPSPLWPAPSDKMWSPFSLGRRDYLRVAGPGVYVGCAYRCERPKELVEDNFIYFILVRKN